MEIESGHQAQFTGFGFDGVLIDVAFSDGIDCPLEASDAAIQPITEATAGKEVHARRPVNAHSKNACGPLESLTFIVAK